MMFIRSTFRSLLHSFLVFSVLAFLLVPSLIIGFYGGDLVTAVIGVVGAFALLSLVRDFAPGPGIFALMLNGLVYMCKEVLAVIWVGATAFMRAMLQHRREEASVRRKRHLTLVHQS